MTTRRLNRSELARIVGNDPRAIREFERLFADVQAGITGPAVININYNSDGTIADPLPIITAFQLVPEGGAAFVSGVSWGVTLLSGSFDGAGATIGGTGSGLLQINSGLATNSVTLGVTARVDGRGYPPLSVTLNKVIAGAGGGGGGLTPNDSVSSFTAFSTGTFAAVTRDLAVTLPTGVTTATLTAASLGLRLANAGPAGTTTAEFKWQRETAPAVWTDVGAVATSSPDAFVDELEDPPLFVQTSGAVTCNRTETGMVAGSAQKFRLVARVSAGNVRSVSITGTASVSS